MKRRFTNMERARIVRKIERMAKTKGIGVIEACKQVGISNPTYYTWRRWGASKATHAPKRHVDNGESDGSPSLSDALHSFFKTTPSPELEARLQILEREVKSVALEWDSFKKAIGATAADLGHN